jgi:hypothetical protein
MNSMVEILEPTAVNLPTPEAASSGPYILPQDRIKLYSSAEWEKFIQEWAFHLKDIYSEVQRCSGAGDKGRDIVAFLKDPAINDAWENFQCKHYDHSLQPGDIWTELGKLCYYTYKNEYTIPKQYFFVAPQAAGPELSRLIRKPTELKTKFLANWVGKCQDKIITGQKVLLDDGLKAHIEKIDFSIFKIQSILTVIEQHSKTKYHNARFGGGLPTRIEPVIPPVDHGDQSVYIKKLLAAYGDHKDADIPDTAALAAYPELEQHFLRSHRQFFCAEALRNFSRDNLPNGSFENLQEQFFEGIVDTVESDHEDGFKRVKETVSKANALQITNHPLVTRLEMRDRGGICHQLADKDRISWVNDDAE